MTNDLIIFMPRQSVFLHCTGNIQFVVHYLPLNFAIPQKYDLTDPFVFDKNVFNVSQHVLDTYLPKTETHLRAKDFYPGTQFIAFGKEASFT